MSETPIYAIWRGIVRRCTDPTCDVYQDYGGRGITVCLEWLSFDRFYADFGHTRPSGAHSIDRRENNDGYHLSNVRWALSIEQQNNRRDNVLISHEGETLTVAQWSRRVGISPECIRQRLKRGWPSAAALTEQPNANRRFL